MYSRGITTFLKAKHVNIKAIDKFLEAEGISAFTSKNHMKSSAYIQKNWEKFATFIDKSIKNKTISGKAVKLNVYYSEQKARTERIKKELENIDEETKQYISYIKKNGVSKIQSFLSKKGINPAGKDYSYISVLQWLPLIKQAIDNNFKESQ